MGVQFSRDRARKSVSGIPKWNSRIPRFTVGHLKLHFLHQSFHNYLSEISRSLNSTNTFSPQLSYPECRKMLLWLCKTSLKDDKTAERSPSLSPIKETTLVLTPLTVSSETSSFFVHLLRVFAPPCHYVTRS